MTLLLKITLVVMLFFIIFNLARALFHMVKEPSSSERGERRPMSHFLGRRLMFSALVVVLLIIALSSGLIEPNSRPY
ncbi:MULTISPECIES: DUF2909 domain-containing protein [unclassified Vibrio]|uniref:DUF2909 domain-containing protein n=1 Tax=unclassified Vibrio TaxID=2614977 RepID=UPI001493BB66|nr:MULTISPECIES: DUF2909 domain-containing protein [unclassified Vibrio]NOI65371.1 DUF2909 domain-containing protein [Vibrio sp. 99-8-1]